MRGSSIAMTLTVMVVAACGDNLAGNTPPTVLPATLTTSEDVPGFVTLTVSDPDADDTIALDVDGAMHGVPSASGLTVEYAPDHDFNGTDQITVTASDGEATAELVIGVTVLPVNDAPIAVEDSFAAIEDTPLVIPQATLLANDIDVDGDILLLDQVAFPEDGTVTINGSDVTFTPNPNFVGDGAFEYVVSDGMATSAVRVDVAVGGANDAPVANDDTAVTAEDTTLDIPLAALHANDTDAEGQTLSITMVDNASAGSIAIVGTDARFIAPPNFNGSATFDYTVSDGAATDIGTVTVTVTPVADAPIAVADTAVTAEDAIVSIPHATLLGNDSDPDGTLPTIDAVSNAMNGSVALTGTTVDFTPAPDFNGAAEFVYTITDGGLFASATVIVTVTPVNDPPVANDDAATTPRDTPITITDAMLLANDVDIDSTLDVTAVSGEQNGTAVLNPASVTFTPAPGFTGTASFEYTAFDGALPDVALVTITVTATETCGDGVIEGSETCDDDGTDPGDGCDATCQTEPGWTCAGEPSVCATVCGDGLVRPGEACDDDDTDPGDGCDATCAIETGWTCAGEPSACDEICGDGMTVGDEECDDNNTDSGDGCTATCVDEFCGDGVDNDGANEACDDGDPDDTDGCTTLCAIGALCDDIAIPGADRFSVDPATGHCYAGFDSDPMTFAGAHAACVDNAGYLATITSDGENGLVNDARDQTQETWIGATDDGNDLDLIFDWVTDEAFGFFTYTPSEPDDDAGLDGNGECLYIAANLVSWGDTNCNITTFVDGFVCELEAVPCGDSVLQPSAGEECDDGNTAGGDGCGPTCVLETLFFSEYVEGSSNNKAIEIRNPTNTPVDLTGCAIRVYANGNPMPSSFNLTATIAANDQFVICNPSSGPALLPLCDITSTVINFNGNDAVELFCSGAPIDVIGQIGVDPGTDWGDPPTITLNATLRRRCPFTNGDTDGGDAFDPAAEWSGYPIDTFGDLGLAGCDP